MFSCCFKTLYGPLAEVLTPSLIDLEIIYNLNNMFKGNKKKGGEWCTRELDMLPCFSKCKTLFGSEWTTFYVDTF